MLKVTDSAGAHLAQLLSDSDAPEEAAVRIAHEDDGWSISLDNAQPEDQTFEHGGRTILVVDRQSAALLDDVTLDVEVQQSQAQLTLTRPREEPT